MNDNVSVDAFKKTKSGRGHGQGFGSGYGRGRRGGRGGYHPRSQSGYCHQSAGKGASAITVARHIHQGSVLPMDRITSTVAKVAITSNYAVQNRDQQHQVEDHAEICTTLNQMKSMSMIPYRLSAK